MVELYGGYLCSRREPVARILVVSSSEMKTLSENSGSGWSADDRRRSKKKRVALGDQDCRIHHWLDHGSYLYVSGGPRRGDIIQMISLR